MILFSYQPGNSIFHRLHPLSRLVLFVLLMIPLATPHRWSLPAIALILISTHLISSINIRISIRHFLFFTIMAGLIFWGQIKQYSLEAALLKTAAFLLALYGGLVFTALSDPMDLGDSLYRLTRRIPLFPAGQLMVLISLTFSFLPLVGEEMQHLRDGLNSRSLNRHFSPIRKVYYHTIPLIYSIIRRSDDIARAMYSRSFQLDPTLLTDNPQWKDLLLCLGGAAFLLVHHLLKLIA